MAFVYVSSQQILVAQLLAAQALADRSRNRTITITIRCLSDGHEYTIDNVDRSWTVGQIKLYFVQTCSIRVPSGQQVRLVYDNLRKDDNVRICDMVLPGEAHVTMYIGWK